MGNPERTLSHGMSRDSGGIPSTAAADQNLKTAAAQYAPGPGGTALNVYPTPQSLAEHEHSTLQVSVLLRNSIAGIGWHTGGAKAANRRVRGGQVYVVPSNQPHDFRLYRPDPMVHFHVGLEALVAVAPEFFNGHDPFAELRIVSDPLISGLAAGVHTAALHPDRLTPMYVDAAWTMLVMHLARLGSSPDDVDKAHRMAMPARRLASVLDHIAGAYGDPSLRISDLAAVAGLSRIHFSRVFARQTGVSPMQYIIDRRLRLARERLSKDDASISSIAQEAGFGSHARLSEAFRRRFGVTPRVYRYTHKISSRSNDDL